MKIFVSKGADVIKMFEPKANGEYFDLVEDISVCTMRIICGIVTFFFYVTKQVLYTIIISLNVLDAAMGIPLEAITDNPAQYIQDAKKYKIYFKLIIFALIFI